MSVNKYLKNLNRLEFVVTHACTGRCIHCSEGGNGGGGHIPPVAAEIIRTVRNDYDITSVMTFGGEPLLFPATVTAIHGTAAECGVQSRQLITNGFFGAEGDALVKAAEALAKSGVNSLLISADAFHQEFIPLERVYAFAAAAKKAGIEGIRLQPAWLVSRDDDNEYNHRTRECLAALSELELPESQGNVIFPAGNAVKYLSEYFERQPLDMSFRCGSAPYTDSLDDIYSLSINPDGSVTACSFTIGNILREDIRDILERYDPFASPAMSALINGGISALNDYAAGRSIHIDCGDCFSPCNLCRKISEALKANDIA